VQPEPALRVRPARLPRASPPELEAPLAAWQPRLQQQAQQVVAAWPLLPARLPEPAQPAWTGLRLLVQPQAWLPELRGLPALWPPPVEPALPAWEPKRSPAARRPRVWPPGLHSLPALRRELERER
jgi:hypothetical protein